MLVIEVQEKAWKVNGFQNFYDICCVWAQEIQEKYYGKFSLNFWIANELFPVARFCLNDVLMVELWHHPKFQTAACLSGKAKHTSTEKISAQQNILMLYLPIESLTLRTPILDTP